MNPTTWLAFLPTGVGVTLGLVLAWISARIERRWELLGAGIAGTFISLFIPRPWVRHIYLPGADLGEFDAHWLWAEIRFRGTAAMIAAAAAILLALFVLRLRNVKS